MPQRDGQAWLGADPHSATAQRTARHNRKQAQAPSVGRRRTRGLASTARRCRRRAWRPSRSSSTVHRPAAPARSSHPPAHSCDLNWPASPRAPTRACTSCVRGTRSHGPAAGPDQRTCTQVSPKAGFALTTPFRIRCARWADIDAPLRYEFGTRLGRVGSPLFLSATLAPAGELHLPSGCAPSGHVCTGTGLAPPRDAPWQAARHCGADLGRARRSVRAGAPHGRRRRGPHALFRHADAAAGTPRSAQTRTPALAPSRPIPAPSPPHPIPRLQSALPRRPIPIAERLWRRYL